MKTTPKTLAEQFEEHESAGRWLDLASWLAWLVAMGAWLSLFVR